MKTITITIPKDLANRLDRLHFEVESRKQLLAFFISQQLDITGDSFIAMKKEYVGLFMELEKCKFEFENTYLAKYPTRRKWSLVGAEGEVRVELGDE